jgi:hypothetical protein
MEVTNQNTTPPLDLVVDERSLRIVYCNSFRINPGPDEMVIDVGFNMPNPNNTDGDKAQVLFSVSDRLVLNYKTAMRLVGTLHQILSKRDEAMAAAGRLGSSEIEIRPSK